MAKVNVNMSVPAQADFARVIDKAQRAGLNVSNSFPDLGIASGQVDEKKIESLRRIEGVGAVEPDREVSAFR